MRHDLAMTPIGAKTHIAMTNRWSGLCRNGIEEIDELMGNDPIRMLHSGMAGQNERPPATEDL
jgi:hypothetical protein